MGAATPPEGCDVVVIALAGGEALHACLRSLTAVQDRCHVMLGENMGDAAAWQPRFPAVKFSDGRALSVPMRRRRGIEAAQGPLVALLEDTGLPEPGWLEGVREAFAAKDVAAAGGPVRIDPALAARHQALACAEYGRFHPDLFPRLALGEADTAGTQVVSRLPGNNFAYRRARAMEILDGQDHGLLEFEVNEILKSRGARLAYQPRMAVLYGAADIHGARLLTRLRHGRLFAGRRIAGRGALARLAWLAGSLLLPAILSARTLAAMTRAVRPAAWPATAFWICLLEGAWALGEGIGYLAGPGKSLEAWR